MASNFAGRISKNMKAVDALLVAAGMAGGVASCAAAGRPAVTKVMKARRE